MSQAANTTFDIKSASIDLLALILKTDDLDALSTALEQRFGKAGKAGAPEAFVVDIEALPSPSTLDLGRLLALLQDHGIKAVGLRHPDAAVASLAAAQNLMHIVESPRSAQATQPATEPPAETPRAPVETTAAPVVQTVVSTAPTMVIDRPVRAGQQIYAKGANLVVLAMVSAGAEIIADGDIHVYAPLRGRALAGARGNTAARIYVRGMEAELVSIAGVYRTLEQALPDSIKGKPTQIFLENERLVMTTLGE